MGRKSSGFGACRCAGRIVRNGGTPVAHHPLVNPTGSTAGTGVRVSGLTVCLWALSLGEAARGSEGKGQWKVRSRSRPPQRRNTARHMCPASLSCITSPPRMTCVRRSGTTHSRPVLSAGRVGGVCRSGLSPPTATPTWKWPSTLPALPQPLSSLTPSQPSLCACCSIPELPSLSDPHYLILLGHGHLLPQAIHVGGRLAPEFPMPPRVPSTAWLHLHHLDGSWYPAVYGASFLLPLRMGTTIGLRRFFCPQPSLL